MIYYCFPPISSKVKNMQIFYTLDTKINFCEIFFFNKSAPIQEAPAVTIYKNPNSTFPSCIWLLRGFCLELYPYCLFRGHGIVFFF